jgi:hypothetical protein
MTPIRGLTTPTNIEQPAPVVEKDRRAVAVPVPPKVKKIIGPCSWEAERPFLDRGPHAGLTWRKVDIEMPWTNELNDYVAHIAETASATPELFYDGIGVIHLRQAIGFLKAMARRLHRFVSAPHGAGADHYDEPVWVKTVYVDPGDGHRFHET